mgnify:CR=1 FL=1
MTERRLALIRHAKSSWKDPGASDHDRVLNKRGRRDAPAMAAELARRGWTPDAVVSSSARRTRETWERMADAFDEVSLTSTGTLYLAGLPEIRHVARDWDDEWETVFVFGHNPGWSAAASALSGTLLEMTTGNCALLVGDGDTWSEALDRDWDLEALLRPREPQT